MFESAQPVFEKNIALHWDSNPALHWLNAPSVQPVFEKNIALHWYSNNHWLNIIIISVIKQPVRGINIVPLWCSGCTLGAFS